MIRDRLTAKFLTAKPARRAAPPPVRKTPAKGKPSAIEVYARGRRLPASVWM